MYARLIIWRLGVCLILIGLMQIEISFMEGFHCQTRLILSSTMTGDILILEIIDMSTYEYVLLSIRIVTKVDTQVGQPIIVNYLETQFQCNIRMIYTKTQAANFITS